MSSGGKFRDCGEMVAMRAGTFLLMALCGLFLFRGASFSSPRVQPPRSAFHIQGRHSGTLFIGHDDAQSGAAVGTALSGPPLAAAEQQLLQSDEPFPLELNGFHYNRPPPRT
ncbi:MAG: hypothetical protein ACRD2U_01335 [Terriglobales bacterium]